MLNQVVLEVPEEGRLSYTHVELWRRDSRGAWALTLLEAGPAASRGKTLVDLTPPPQVTFAVQGKALPYEYKGATYSIEFTGSEPLSGAEVSSQVVTKSQHLQVRQGLGGLRFETRAVGALESLRFPQSDAAGILDLPMDLTLWGSGGSLPLQLGKTRYAFVDPQGQSDSRYLYRLVSAFYPDLSSDFSFAVPPVSEMADQVTLRFQVFQNDGSRSVGTGVTIYLDALYTEAGFSPDVAKDLVADSEGFVQLSIRRGCTGTVTLPGSRTTRRFKTPADPAITLFNPFAPEYGVEEDAFTVRKDPWNDTAKVIS